jgi:AraC-like DNA-binding protein
VKKDHLQELLRNVPFPTSPSGAARVREILEANGIDPADIYQRLEMSARFADAHQDISYPGDPIHIHSHTFHELVYCITGGVDYQVGADRFHLNHGDVLSIPAGITHAPMIPEQLSEPYRRYVLWLSQEFTQLITTVFLPESAPDGLSPFLLHTAGTPWEYIGEYFRRCAQEGEQRHYHWDAALFGIASELCVHLSRCRQGSQGDEKPELLDRIMAHVEAHLSEKITLPDVAARFWVSQSTISQLFRKKMGISFYRYVTLRRLTEAKVLIKTGIPMDQISIAVGFQDYSTFYRAFKSEFGISPAQYRKMN